MVKICLTNFSLTRLKNDNGKAINLDIEVLELIHDYYLGKLKHYSRNPLDDIEAELEEED